MLLLSSPPASRLATIGVFRRSVSTVYSRRLRCGSQRSCKFPQRKHYATGGASQEPKLDNEEHNGSKQQQQVLSSSSSTSTQGTTTTTTNPHHRSWLEAYLCKWKGQGTSPPCPPLETVAWTGLNSFLGLTALAGIHYGISVDAGMTALIGSFGASAALVYGAPSAPFSQPRNVIGGHMLSAAVGVASHEMLLPFGEIIAAPVCVASSIMLMQLTRTLHPPAAATALIAVMGSAPIHELGWTYVVFPCGAAPSLLCGLGLVLNNLRPGVKYPAYWR